MITTVVELDRPLDIRLTLGQLTKGSADPCARFADGDFWQAMNTPAGPATVRVMKQSDSIARVDSWGAGAEWVIAGAGELLGQAQSDGIFSPINPVVADLHRRLRGLRITRTRRVFELAVPTILEQRVTTREAFGSYRRLCQWMGRPAPGPAKEMGLRTPPRRDEIAATPTWAFHRLGVERKRAEALVEAARVGHRLDECVDLDIETARQRLRKVRGIGPWTAGLIALNALGDEDAVVVGDFHLPNYVSWALAGEARGTDERMLELLAEFEGQRGRVIRLIMCGADRPPKFGPRYSPLPIAQM